MKNKLFDIILWIVTFVFVAMIFLLPETIPIHWNLNGEVDNYGSRYFCLILSFLPIISYYGMLLTRNIDPNQKEIEARIDTYEFMRKLISSLFIAIQIFFYYMVLVKNANVQIGLCTILGIFLIAIGNYLPKVPQNYFLGVKTPWALKNDIVWKKTNKVGGYCFVGFGLLIIVAGFIKHIGFYLIVLGCLIIVIIPLVYSYFIYKKIDK